MPCMIRVAVLLAVPVTCAIIFVAIARSGDAPIHQFQKIEMYPSAAEQPHGREVADAGRPRG